MERDFFWPDDAQFERLAPRLPTDTRDKDSIKALRRRLGKLTPSELLVAGHQGRKCKY